MHRREFLRAAGAGAGALGAAGSTAATATAQDEDGGNQTEDGAGEAAPETVTVGPGGDTTFDPETLPIEPGTTVVWEWDSSNHNVNPTSIPDDAEWEGHQPIEDEGFTYEYTFDVVGTYDYQCDPHAPGMAGSVEVTEDTGGGGQQGPTVPASALSLGIGIVAAMSSTMALAFFFLKYGRSDEE